MSKITLAMLSAQAVEQVQSEDNALTVIETGARATAAMLVQYIEGLGVKCAKPEDVRNTKEYADAAEALKAAYRSQYCNKARKGINKELARMVLDAPESARADWAKGSEEKKTWDAILAFGRTKLQRVADIAYPREAKGGTDSGSTKAKRAPTADAVLANVKAFMEANRGADKSALVKNLFDQIRKEMLG